MKYLILLFTIFTIASAHVQAKANCRCYESNKGIPSVRLICSNEKEEASTQSKAIEIFYPNMNNFYPIELARLDCQNKNKLFIKEFTACEVDQINNQNYKIIGYFSEKKVVLSPLYFNLEKAKKRLKNFNNLGICLN